MTYAQGRRYLDADSHIMELPDFLDRFADAGIVESLAPLRTDAAGGQGVGMDTYAETRRHSEEQIAVLEADVMASGKGYEALGAFDPSERSHALDLLGFEAQLVFGTFGLDPFLHHPDMDMRYGGCRAYNRAITDFCAADRRLLPVGVVSLADATRALVEVEQALDQGCVGIWVPAEPAGDRSPGHIDLDPLWALLAERRAPFFCHVGAQRIPIRDEYMVTGRPVAPGFAGGGEALRAKDFPMLHHSTEEFLSVLVLDGVLERHPDLRGAAVELGAGWVPAMIRRLDHTADHLAKFDPIISGFTRRPSEQVRAQLAFTPFPFEDVAQLIAESSDELYLFSTDYPHVEGGRNPLGRFERSLVDASEATRERFYSGNFLRILPAVASLLGEG